jgi:FecR protein
MKNLRLFALGLFSTLFIISAVNPAFADEDPPSRVARLKYISGQVSIQPGGVNDWVAANVNRPLTTSDNVWTDKDSRAELHLGSAAMRMNAETSLTLTNLSDNTVQVELHQGTMNLRIVHLFRGEIYEIDTPNTAFTITKSGSYRFDVDSNADTSLVTVWSGEGVATDDGPAVRVRSKEQARFTGKGMLENAVSRAPGYDGFDEWCRVRDRREDGVISARYVSRDVIGYEDLDEYGHWRYIAGYGWTWVPEVAYAGWAPYRYGHWIWVSPWGWTWVDDAAWGFAPFHYGRWIYTSGYWGWVPGPRLVRPCYAPALVAWIGGANFGVSISVGGGVGWVPLGYGEPYVPYYHASRNYFQSVNVSNTHITNITYVTNNYYNNSVNIRNIHYVNQRVPGAVTAVPRDVLVHSRPVHGEAWKIGDRDLRDARAMADPDVHPERHSVLGLHADERAHRPPDRVFSRPVVSHVAPPPRREPFDARYGRSGDDRDRGREAQDNSHGRDMGRGRDHDDNDRGRNPSDVARGHDNDNGSRGRENDNGWRGRDNDNASRGRDNDSASRGRDDNNGRRGRDFPHPDKGNDRGSVSTGPDMRPGPHDRDNNGNENGNNGNSRDADSASRGRDDNNRWRGRDFPRPGNGNDHGTVSTGPDMRPGQHDRDNNGNANSGNANNGNANNGQGYNGSSRDAEQASRGNDNSRGRGHGFPRPGSGNDNAASTGATSNGGNGSSSGPDMRPGPRENGMNRGSDSAQQPNTQRSIPRPDRNDNASGPSMSQSQSVPDRRPAAPEMQMNRGSSSESAGSSRQPFPHPSEAVRMQQEVESRNTPEARNNAPAVRNSAPEVRNSAPAFPHPSGPVERAPSSAPQSQPERSMPRSAPSMGSPTVERSAPAPERSMPRSAPAMEQRAPSAPSGGGGGGHSAPQSHGSDGGKPNGGGHSQDHAAKPGH